MIYTLEISFTWHILRRSACLAVTKCLIPKRLPKKTSTESHE